MAARRLMIVMLVLLGISAAAAALVPTRESNEDTVGSTESGTTGAETTGTAEDAPRATSEQEASPTFDIKVGGSKLPIVPVTLGQRVTLIVRCDLADQLEIPALGLIEPVAPGAPARFELLPEEPGDLGIRLIGEDRVVARIEVRPEARGESGRPGSKNRGEPGRS